MITKPEDRDKKIVRDGEHVRVPIVLMDELQRSVQVSRFHDGMGRDAGHRPGYIFVRGHDQSVAQAAHETHVKLLGDAWRGATSVGSSAADNAYANYIDDLTGAWRSP